MFGLIKRRGAYEVIEGDSKEAVAEAAKAERAELLLAGEDREKLEVKRAALQAAKDKIAAARKS